MMTVSRRDGHAANSMQKVGCVMDANTPIIAAAQSAAVGHFNEAPVRTYVMLLVERRATAQLRDQARRAAADADGQGRPS